MGKGSFKLPTSNLLSRFDLQLLMSKLSASFFSSVLIESSMLYVSFLSFCFKFLPVLNKGDWSDLVSMRLSLMPDCYAPGDWRLVPQNGVAAKFRLSNCLVSSYLWTSIKVCLRPALTSSSRLNLLTLPFSFFVTFGRSFKTGEFGFRVKGGNSDELDSVVSFSTFIETGRSLCSLCLESGDGLGIFAPWVADMEAAKRSRALRCLCGLSSSFSSDSLTSLSVRFFQTSLLGGLRRSDVITAELASRMLIKYCDSAYGLA